MRLVIPRAAFRRAIVLAVATGLTTVAVPLGTAAASAPSAVIQRAPEVGIASQVFTASASSARVVSTQPRGARQMPRRARAAGARLAQPATASSANVANVAEPSSSGGSSGLLQHFNGVSSLDSEVTNFGAKFEPPDQGLCEGNGFVLEPVNSAYTIYHTNGTPIAGPFNVNDLFHLGGLEFTSDPRCYYDPTTNTWFVIILFLATNPDGSFGNTSAIYISVNRSGDPTTAWTTYTIDTTHPNAPAASQCPCFGDQPRFGIDDFNVYLSTDEFSINGTAFNGAQLYAVAKRDLVGLKHHLHFAHFDNPTFDGNPLFAIEPATTIGPAPAEYFLNALDLNLDGTTANHIGVWAMTNRKNVAEGRAPTLSSVMISSEPYSLPPPAVQKGSAKPLDSGDDRMQQVQFINGKLWGELDTALAVVGDSTPRAAAAWFSVTPTLSNSDLLSATMSRQGYVASRGNYVLYPALQADIAGNVAMVVSISGPNRYPSAAFTTMGIGQSAFGRITIAAAGTGPYTPKVNQFGRWGDYSYAQLDPATDTFWFATEYVPSLTSQTTNRIRNWGTEVLQVKVGGAGNQN